MNFRTVCYGASSLAALLLASGNAMAADDSSGANPKVAAADSGQALGDIIVTARHTSENVQHSPLAISAISAQQLESRGVANVTDISAAIPNVTFVASTASFGRSVTAFVRGIGQSDSSIAFNPAVGFYLDDVYIGSMTGSDLALADVASIDVLRGPQGTLFGANTESGAVQVHTVKPKGDDTGYIDAAFGTRDHVKVKGAFDLSLVENVLAVRISGFTDQQKGYLNLVDFACKYPSQAGTLQPINTPQNGCSLGRQGGTDQYGARIALRWTPGKDVEVNLAADYANDKSETPATTLISLNAAALAHYNAVAVVPHFGIPLDSRFLPPNPYVSYATGIDPFNGQKFGNGTVPLEQWGVAGTINWTPSADFKVKSVTSYRSYNGFEYGDNNAAPIPNGLSYQSNARTQFSQELDASGTLLKGSLEWTVGGFYYKSLAHYLGDIDLTAVIPPFGTSLHFLPKEDAEDLNKSAFVHAIYHITDKLGLEAGVRYTNQSKSFNFSQNPASDNSFDITATGPVFPTPTTATLFPRGAFTFTNNVALAEVKRWDPKVTLNYQVNNDLMVYASYATGFKGGGVNPYVVASAAELTPYGAETLKSYEVGFKSEWFDHKARLNVSAFVMDYKNLQEQVNLAALGGLPIEANVGSARLKGVEFEFLARPVAGLTFNASGGYLNYETLDCGSACVAVGGSIPANGLAPYTPKFKGSVGAEYKLSLGEKLGTLTPRVDVNYQSHIFFNTSNTPGVEQNAYTVVNAHISWMSSDNKWGLQLDVSNLFNQFYWANEYAVPSLGSNTGNPAVPRQFLVTAKRKF